MSDLRERARTVLAASFGFDDFRGSQFDVIEHVIGGGDALVIMPTGGGKSLCYQLPALLSEGTTIVLSPLIALMQDQVDALRAKGIPATFINSSLDRQERDRRLGRVLRGEERLLYVTPERFRKPDFRARITTLDIALLAVDEAHCISSWGHDFRPDYGRVGRIREALGEPPTIALTATATPRTQRDILDRLGIPDARVFHTGIDRPNLFIAAREVSSEEERIDRILEVVDRMGGPGIVYMALIRDLRKLEDLLLRRGVRPLVYHGRLSPNERREMQRAFLASRDAIVLATNAFGMGVDKADIRFILHGQIPGSLEAFYQEIGRSGRDGRPAFCELLYESQDVMTQKQFLEWANPSPEFVRNAVNVMESWGENLYAHDEGDIRDALLMKNRSDGRVATVIGILRAEGIVEGEFERGDFRLVRPLEPGEESRLVDPKKRAHDLERLLEMVDFARSDGCRRGRLNTYFGFEESGPCGVCDGCRPAREWLDELPPRAAPAPASVGAVADQSPAEAPVRRGDWLLVNGRHHVVVRRVEVSRSRVTVECECADDLQIRTYDLGRVRWKLVE